MVPCDTGDVEVKVECMDTRVVFLDNACTRDKGKPRR